MPVVACAGGQRPTGLRLNIPRAASLPRIDGMRPRPIAWLIIAGLILAGGGVRPASGDDAPRWRELVRQLAAESFHDREQAARELAESPAAEAIPSLVQLAQEGAPEAVARAVRQLELWFVQAPEPVSIEAERALMQLSVTGPEVAAAEAARALEAHQKLRQHRAVAALRQLGAKVDMGPDRDSLRIEYNLRHAEIDEADREATINMQLRPPSRNDELFDAGPDAEAARRTREQLPQVPQQVFLTGAWKGGVEGVWHLGRLSSEVPLQVYVVNGSGLSREDVLAATQGIQYLNVEPRGPNLGVRNKSMPWREPGCHIDGVLPGSAAERAELEPGDQVLSVDGNPIRNFPELVQAVAEHKVGDQIELQVVRLDQVQKIVVTLGDWIEVDTEAELWSPQIESRRIIIPNPDQKFPK